MTPTGGPGLSKSATRCARESLRIVLVTQWFPPEKAALPFDLATDLAKAGHDVTVLTGFPNYPEGRIYDGWRQRPWSDERLRGFSLRRVALYPSHDRSAVRRALNYLSFAVTCAIFGWRALRQADVVYVYHPPLTAALGPVLSCIMGGAPVVLHVQDLWPESVADSGLVSGPLARLLYGSLSRLCDLVYGHASRIIAIAPTMGRLLAERGVPDEKLSVIPNWADEELYYPKARAQPGCPFAVMFAGNLGHVQALDVAIRALSLDDAPREMRLVLVGSGVAEPGLRELANATPRGGRVEFLGQQPMSAMNDLTSAADVQLVSLKDLLIFHGTIPSKLASVFACGLPVICSVAGDAADLVRAAGAGWTCPPDDPAALARAFRAAEAAGHQERLRRGAAGRAYYEAHLNSAAGLAAVATVLCEAAASRRSRRSGRRNPF